MREEWYKLSCIQLEWLNPDVEVDIDKYITDLCPNSPFGDYYPELIEEVLSRYEVDGIYVEGVYIPPGFCYCNSCQEMFSFIYGRPLPIEEPLKDADYNEFRQRSITNFYRKIRERVNKISPKTVVFGCGYYPASINLYDFSRYVDVVVSEEQWGYTSGYNPAEVPLWEVGMHMKLIRSESNKPVNGTTFVSKHVDYEYVPRSSSHLKLATMEIVSAGASPQVHTQNIFEVDESSIPILRQLFSDVKFLKPYLDSSKPFTKVALFNWMDPSDSKRMGDGIFQYTDRGIKGFYRALLENHIQTEFVTPRDILNGRLRDYKVLVMSDALYMSDEVVMEIKNFICNGGGLVSTFRSGWYTRNGRRLDKPILSEVLGIENYYSIVKRPNSIHPVVPFYHTYYNINSTGLIWRDLNGKVLSFQGSYIEIETDDEVEEIGYILNFDYTKVHSEHWLKSGYPGEKVSPMIISKTIDRGKSIYCATDFEIYSLEYGDSESIEVLTNLVKYVGGEEIELVKIKAPGTVEVNPYVSENSLVIFLLNHTTNQLTTGKAVRYIIPIKDITIEVNWNKRLESAFCLSKSNLDLKREESKIILTLPYLEEYDVIVLKE